MITLPQLHALLARMPERAYAEIGLELVSILVHHLIPDDQWTQKRESELTYALKCQFDLPLESWEVRRNQKPPVTAV